MARPYAAFLQNAILPPPIPGVVPRAGMPCPFGAPTQALKLTDAAARLGEALCGVPTERNPSTPHTRGCTPGWYAVPRWGTHSSAKAYRRGGGSWRGPMRRSYRTQSFHTPIPGVAPRAGMPCPVGTPTQALKLTDAAACLGEALCGVPTERNPSTPHTRGCTPGWYAVPRWGTHSSAKAYRRGGASWRSPMRRSYRTQSFHPPYPGLHPGLVCRAPLGHPLKR